VLRVAIAGARLDAQRTGQGRAQSPATLRAAIDEADWMKRERWAIRRCGHSTPIRFADETGSQAFVAACFNPGSGGIHPLNYLHGLAEGLAQRGVAIFQESPALRRRREPGRHHRRDGRKAPVRARAGDHRPPTAIPSLTPATQHMQRTLVPSAAPSIATDKRCRPTLPVA